MPHACMLATLFAFIFATSTFAWSEANVDRRISDGHISTQVQHMHRCASPRLLRDEETGVAHARRSVNAEVRLKNSLASPPDATDPWP
eukprot:391882-Rhodomonas_salina.4